MSLTYSLVNARDLLEKLKRDVKALENEVTGDRFFNFAVTAYHLIDWIKNDTKVSKKIRDASESMYKEASIAICRDIANASKHFTLKKGYKNQVTSSVKSVEGYGTGRYGKGLYGKGEEQIDIECIDGTKINSLELARQVLATWEAFFFKHSL